MTADQIIKMFDLTPHPEGGFYRQTWQEPAKDRASMTMIYFLLTDQQRSHWHRVDATEFWLFHAGDPLVLSISETDAGPATEHVLSSDLSQGAPQVRVPTDHWQSARTTGAWSLVSCAVSPGFEFSGFTLAAPDFDIKGGT